MIAYDVVNRPYFEPALEEAKRADLGVVAMKLAQAVFEPDRSTRPRPERVALLDRIVPGELNTYQKASRFGLSNPRLSAVRLAPEPEGSAGMRLALHWTDAPGLAASRPDRR